MVMVDDVMFSNKSNEWGTPISLFRKLDTEFNFTLDPCANKNRIMKKSMKQYDIKDNGLIRSWGGERVFVNPPYGDLEVWIKKCSGECHRADVIVMLIPARTDTKPFHSFIYHKHEIRFIKGRIRFIDHRTFKQMDGAPFPSMLVIFRKNHEKIWW